MDGSSETQDAAPTQESHASRSRCRPAVGNINSRLTISKCSSCRISCRYIESPNEDFGEQTISGDAAGVLLRPVFDNELVRQGQLPTMWHGAPSGRRANVGDQPTPRPTWCTGDSPDNCPADQTRGAGRNLPSCSSGHAQSRCAPERDRASSCSGARSAAAAIGSESLIKS